MVFPYYASVSLYCPRIFKLIPYDSDSIEPYVPAESDTSSHVCLSGIR
jgi:hypothetical protein